MFGTDGFHVPLRISVSGEFHDLIESDAVTVGGSTALAGSHQAVLTAKDPASTTVSADVGNLVVRIQHEADPKRSTTGRRNSVITVGCANHPCRACQKPG